METNNFKNNVKEHEFLLSEIHIATIFSNLESKTFQYIFFL